MMESNDLVSSMSVFDPRHLPDTEAELSDYGMEKMRTLMDFYSVAQRVRLNEDEGVSQPDIETKESQNGNYFGESFSCSSINPPTPMCLRRVFKC